MATADGMLAAFNSFAQLFNQYFLDVQASTVAPPAFVLPRNVEAPVTTTVNATATPTLTSITSPLTTGMGTVDLLIAGSNISSSNNAAVTDPHGTVTARAVIASWDGRYGYVPAVDLSVGGTSTGGTWTVQLTTTLSVVGNAFTFVVANAAAPVPVITSVSPSSPGAVLAPLVINGANFGAHPHAFLFPPGIAVSVPGGTGLGGGLSFDPTGSIGSGDTSGTCAYVRIVDFRYGPTGTWRLMLICPDTGQVSNVFSFTVTS